MARIVKEHKDRKAELLSAARTLFLQLGYEHTSVNAIIEEVGVSKGAFYHYFKSKEDLLDSLVEQLTKEGMAFVQPVVEEEGLTALERLNKFFGVIRGWKAENMPLMMAIMRAMYRDENLVLRHKMMERNAAMVAPLLSRIVVKGVEEGVLDTAYPEDAGEMVYRVAMGFTDMVARLLLDLDQHPENVEVLEQKLALYQDAIERVLGAPRGSIRIVDETFMQALKGASRSA